MWVERETERQTIHVVTTKQYLLLLLSQNNFILNEQISSSFGYQLKGHAIFIFFPFLSDLLKEEADGPLQYTQWQALQESKDLCLLMLICKQASVDESHCLIDLNSTLSF